MDLSPSSAALTPSPIQMQRYYPEGPCYHTTQPLSILSIATSLPIVGSINLFIWSQPHLQADHAVPVLLKSRLAQSIWTSLEPRIKSNESRWPIALSDPPVEQKGTVFVRPTDYCLKGKSQQQQFCSMLVQKSRTQKLAFPPSQMLGLSMDCDHAHELTLSARCPGTTNSFPNKDTTSMPSRYSTGSPRKSL